MSLLYADTNGKQLVEATDMSNTVDLGSGGSELIITRRSDGEYQPKCLDLVNICAYYRQKPRPSPTNGIAITLASSAIKGADGEDEGYEGDEPIRVEAMRSKMGMKSNVIRNLPKNVTY
ncbi:hypothetical protein LOK49_LG10G01070 [Camellia lanceoleosa]|uniref:Uncharacterized protein n=1 Tax=Camellia lanceoleosa TaxID=1840588 RepID=A0ACC0G651_9ERIC|nr:hypothetical protein LOK49_LG10G01070 [Camellia lanceoleosa]